MAHYASHRLCGHTPATAPTIATKHPEGRISGKRKAVSPVRGGVVSVVTVRSTPVDGDLPGGDCPSDVVDRLLWRNAQRIMSRHAIRLDGTCRWCAQAAPCEARRLAVRALEVARLPWQESWQARNEITSLLPVVTAQLRRTGPVARIRTRNWIRVNVRAPEPDAAQPPAPRQT
jgi:hypothetical protein